MRRRDAVKEFFLKSVLPVIGAEALYFIYKSACMKDGVMD